MGYTIFRPSSRRASSLAVSLVLGLGILAGNMGRAEAGVWTNLSGLPTPDVFAVAGSDSGSVLVATHGLTEEVSEYDGLRLRRLSARYSPPPDFGTNITCLAYAANRDLWVGTSDQGAFRLRPGGFVQFRNSDGLGNRQSNHVRRILPAGGDTVWVATRGGGLSLFDGSTWTSFTTDQGLPSNNVEDVVRASDGSLWLALDTGLVHFAGGIATSFPVGALNRLLLAADGRIWATSPSQGAYVWTPGVPSPQHYMAPAIGNDLACLAEGPHGDIWLGSFNGGLFRFNGGNFEHYSTSTGSGLVNDTVRDLLVDRAGVLWVGTAGGTQRYEGSLWLTFSVASHGLPGGFVKGLARGPLEDLSPPEARGVTRGPVYVALDNKPSGSGGLVRLAGLRSEPVLDGGNPLLGPFAAVAAVPGGAWAGTYGDVVHVQGNSVSARYTLPPTQTVYSLLAARNGSVWAGTEDSLYRFNGTTWSSFAVPGFLTPGPGRVYVTTLAEDAAGRIWAGSKGGRAAARFDPTSGAVELFDSTKGVPSPNVYAILVSPSGDVWLATDGGAARVSGSQVAGVITIGTGLPSNQVRSLGEDQLGRLWVGTRNGVAYVQNGAVATYAVGDGLPSSVVTALLADTSQAVLGSDQNGAALFRRDGRPPRATLLGATPPVLGVNTIDLSFDGGDLESQDPHNRFAPVLDSPAPPPAQAYTPDKSVRLEALADGIHVFRLYARDRALNISFIEYPFEVDATPPQPVLSAPAFGSVVHGDTTIRGSVDDTRFAFYKVEVRPAGVDDPVLNPWDTLATGTTPPPPDTPLATWRTGGYPDGIYELRVTVRDQLGLVGYAAVKVTVDNLAPYDAVTSPARIDNEKGGRVFTLHSEVEAYFPPRALDDDRIVAIDSLPQPATLPPGTAEFIKAWQIRMRSGLSFVPIHAAKPVTLRFRVDSPAAALAPGERAAEVGVAVIARDAAGNDQTLGGTFDAQSGTITTTARDLDTFVIARGLFAASAAGRDLSIQPRAFSPNGHTFDDRAAVSFNLAESGGAKVFVYDRGGRLVRRVFDGTLGPGRNVVYWDGRDGNGDAVPSGVYVVALQVGSATDVSSVAVVNR